MNKFIEYMGAFANIFIFIFKVFRGLYRFFTDSGWRHIYKERYWNWKSKFLVVLMIPIISFATVMLYERDNYPRQVKQTDKTGKVVLVTAGTPTWRLWYDCWMEDWDVGRDTEFSIVSGSCVIDTGKKDADGNVVWTKVKRDVAIGDFQ